MRLESMSDDAIAAQIGKTIKSYRLRRNLTQDQLAQEIGVSKPTVGELEAGRAKVTILIAALRALRRLDLLAALIAEPRKSPIEAVKMSGKRRVRASPAIAKAKAKATARAVVQRTTDKDI